MIARIATALTLSLTLGAAPAMAQDLEHWGSSDYWDVMIDPTLGYGCLIQGSFRDGSVIRVGFDRNKGVGYVTAFNENWGDIEEGAYYPVSFTLDGEAFEGEAKGIYLNEVPGADIEFDNVDFFMSIAQRQTMTLYHDDYEVLTIDLTGTMKGLEAVLECQDEQG
jgi:hypothetical protein